MLLARQYWQSKGIERRLVNAVLALQADSQLGENIHRWQVIDRIEAFTLCFCGVEGVFGIMPDSKRLQQQHDCCQCIKPLSFERDVEHE